MSNAKLDIVFDGPPGPIGPHFIEVERNGKSTGSIGNWVQRKDGLWAIRLHPVYAFAPKLLAALKGARQDATDLVIEAAAAACCFLQDREGQTVDAEMIGEIEPYIYEGRLGGGARDRAEAAIAEAEGAE